MRSDLGPITQTDFGFTGQRNIASLGLYDYNARMYDPYLNRWSQPDTIVSDLNNPQSLNRFTYANNSPILFSDPTGHTACVGKNADDGPQCFGKTDDERLARFGISASGLSDKEKAKLASAAIDIGVAMAAKRGGTAESQVKLLRISVVKSDSDCDSKPKCFGDVDPATATFTIYQNANVDLESYNRFLVHEIGHIFDLRTGAGYGSDELQKATITFFDGTYASGVHPENGAWERTDAGYTCNDFPCEEHPVKMTGGTTPQEDFADMFMNWVYNSFDYSAGANGAGQSRYDWINNHMNEWLH